MIKTTVSGDTRNTDRFLARMIRGDLYSNVEKYAQQGVDALRSATPRESGLTAESWTYEIEVKGASVIIRWLNTNVINGFNVAIGLQYGHGTGSGGYVAGRDFINPAIKPIFDKIAEGVWKEVQNA